MYNEYSTASPDAGMFGMMSWVIMLAGWLIFGYLMYRIARKCGRREDAWWSYIPVLNFFLWARMASKPTWWGILFLVPVVNIVMLFVTWYKIAQNAGHPGFWGIIAWVPFIQIVAWLVMAFATPTASYPTQTPQHAERPRQPVA